MKIDYQNPDSPNGKAVLNRQGKPIGIVHEIENNNYISSLYIKKLLNRKQSRKNITAVLDKCAQFGITSVQDNTWSFTAIKIFRQLLKNKKLKTRVSCWAYGAVPIFRIPFNMQRFNPHWYSKGPVKFFIDGTFSAKTAWLNEAYAQSGNNYGAGIDKNEMKRILDKEIKYKNQAAFHAIGDRAVHEYLNALEELIKKYPYIPQLRLRLEHAQLIKKEDIPRLKKLGVLIAAQPTALLDHQKDIMILGKERALSAYPFRSLLNAGIPLSFGSDAPGESILNPFEGIHFAVNRTGPEKISVQEALTSYTRSSAYAEFKEEHKGMIKKGMLADFLIASANPLKIEEKKLKDIKIVETVVDGKVVYSS